MRADDWPFATAAERADYERVERLYGALAATVDPADPWSHPDASLLDSASLGRLAALRRCLARRDPLPRDGVARARRRLDRVHLAPRRAPQVGGGRGGGLLRLRPLGVAPGHRGQRRGGGAAWRVALEGRIRLGAVVEAVSVSASGCSRAPRGRRDAAGGCGRLRPARRRARATIAIEGVAPERLASLRAPAERPRRQGGDGLRPLDLGRRRRERPLRGRGRDRLDLAAARRRALGARAARAARAAARRRRRRPRAARPRRARADVRAGGARRAVPCTCGSGAPIRSRAAT